MLFFLELYNLLLLWFCRTFLPFLSFHFPSWIRRVTSESSDKDLSKATSVLKNHTLTLEDQEKKLRFYFVSTNLIILGVSLLLPEWNGLTHSMWNSHAWLWYWFQLYYEVFGCYFVFEILEYTLHRCLHSSFLFHRIHYLHHQTLANDSITGFFMHPFDVIIQIILPTFLPVYFLSTCQETTLCFFCLAFFFIHTGHSGYEITHLFSGEYHYLHHKKVNIHYSAIEPYLLELKRLIR